MAPRDPEKLSAYLRLMSSRWFFLHSREVILAADLVDVECVFENDCVFSCLLRVCGQRPFQFFLSKVNRAFDVPEGVRGAGRAQGMCKSRDREAVITGGGAIERSSLCWISRMMTGSITHVFLYSVFNTQNKESVI